MIIKINDSTFGIHDEYLKALIERNQLEISFDDEELYEKLVKLKVKLEKEKSRLTKREAITFLKILYKCYFYTIDELIAEAEELDQDFYKVDGCVPADDKNMKKVQELYSEYYQRTLEIERIIYTIGRSISDDFFIQENNRSEEYYQFIKYKSSFNSIYSFIEFLCS